ncbi:MAG: hypothetical protein ACD_79C00073G0001 [uncultured bacterium]|nr:MAG: hypothetical protein ACD_79C00073G0001 [uncultured bacterium]
MLKNILKKAENEEELLNNEILYLLDLTDKDDLELLYNTAYKIKKKYVGEKVYLRGIVELSNYCIKDCYYCGIRKSNAKIRRFIMKEEEILKAAEFAFKVGYGSIVLQSGERQDKQFVEFIEDILIKIKKMSAGKLGITLSLGEQDEKTFLRWFNAGARRYLLRIETSNSSLYKKIHPLDHDFDKRKQCLNSLKKIGYQVGTGVLIGIPYQTLDHLLEDLIFFKKTDVDMIGMGPYVVHEDTPLGEKACELFNSDAQLELGLKMIALARIILKDVNIASTTALQALDPLGREKGLKAGANIIMPNITDMEYRKDYQLYNNKPCINEDPVLCQGCLESRIKSIGEEIGFNEWGDSPHFNKSR